MVRGYDFKFSPKIKFLCGKDGQNFLNDLEKLTNHFDLKTITRDEFTDELRAMFERYNYPHEEAENLFKELNTEAAEAYEGECECDSKCTCKCDETITQSVKESQEESFTGTTDEVDVPLHAEKNMDKFVKNLAKRLKMNSGDKPCECPKSFDDICKSIMDLHRRKNTDYGNAFHELYKKFGALTYVYPRLFEKLSRVETLLKNKQNANTSTAALVEDEKIQDTLLDIATYCIMTVEEMQYD